MTGIFKQKASVNALLLVVYGLVLKFGVFLNPAKPLQQQEDQFLYTWLVELIAPLHLPAVFFGFITFLLLYSQAMLLTRIFNAQKMLTNVNYLPGMAYLLVTSLFAEWNQFSAPLLVNSFLIWIFYRLIALSGSSNPGTSIFNIGLMMGIVTLLYKPALVFVLLVLVALFIMRPLRIREWLISLLGITTPYYFLGILLYLTNNWNWEKLRPDISFSLPVMPGSVFITISIALLVLPFIIGGFFVQANLNKMFIQVRKSWSLLLLFLIIATSIVLVDGGINYVNWLLCAIPLTGFHAAAFYFPKRPLFPLVLHWLLFIYALFVNYWL